MVAIWDSAWRRVRYSFQNGLPASFMASHRVRWRSHNSRRSSAIKSRRERARRRHCAMRALPCSQSPRAMLPTRSPAERVPAGMTRVVIAVSTFDVPPLSAFDLSDRWIGTVTCVTAKSAKEAAFCAKLESDAAGKSAIAARPPIPQIRRCSRRAYAAKNVRGSRRDSRRVGAGRRGACDLRHRSLPRAQYV